MEMWTGDWLGRRARYTPHKEGLVVLSGAQHAGLGRPGEPPLRLTFDQWNRRANRTAHLLRSYGVEKGDRVGVISQNCVEMLDLLFACGKLGAIYTPYNWRLTAAEMRPMVEDADPKLLCYGPHFDGVAAEMEVGRAIAMADFDSLLEAFPQTAPPPVSIDLEDPWMILYTGGTTGRSKGAIISHRQVTWNAWNTIAGWGLSPEDRVPILTPFFHTGGLHVFTTPLVQLGGTSILMGHFDPGLMLETIQSERISILFMVPTMFQMVMNHPQFAGADFSGVRFMISGGAPCPRPIYEAYWAKGVVFKSGYGMTEVGPNCFVLPDHEMKRKVGSVGFPIFHAGMRIMADDGRPCGPNEVGELQITGPHLCSGYWRNPDATRQANPDGWFHTGDLAVQYPDGYMKIKDRSKDIIISGGENISSIEVEDVLYRHPAVLAAAVVAKPDERWGETPCAFVELKAGAQVTAQEIVAHCKKHLAGFKVPRAVVFGELPKTSTGKIQKFELRKQAGSASAIDV